MERRDGRTCLFFIIPLLLLVVAALLISARGPFWLADNSDPAYAYLLNALDVAEFKAPQHIDHPGTTLQTIGAVIITTLHAFRQDGSLEFSVLSHPEFYLAAINFFLVGANILADLALGFVAYAVTRSLGLSLVAQSGPLLATVNLLALSNVSPEPLLVCVVTVMALLVVLSLQHMQKRPLGFACLFAVLTGFGLATKITFLPFVLMPLFLLPHFASRLFYVFSTVIGFFLFTAPMAQNYGRFFSWASGLFWHAGFYGSGRATVIDPAVYLQNLTTLLVAHPAFTVLHLVALMMVVVWGRKKGNDNFILKAILALVSVAVLQLLIVAKHAADRYLLPALLLSGLLIFFMLLFLQQEFLVTKKVRKFFTMIFVAILVLALGKSLGDVAREYNHWRQAQTNGLNLVAQVAHQFAGFTQVLYYRSSSPEYALKFGTDFSGPRSLLGHLYPAKIYFYDIWHNRFFDWTGEVSLQTIFQNGPGLFRGTPLHEKNRKLLEEKFSLHLQEVQRGSYEILYAATIF